MPRAANDSMLQKAPSMFSSHWFLESLSQNRRTWELRLWSSSSHYQMMPLTLSWYSCSSLHFCFCPINTMTLSYKSGSRKGRGRRSWERLLLRKGVLFDGLCQRVQNPELACGFAVGCRALPVPASRSWPAQAWSILAASSFLFLRAAGPNPLLRHPGLLLSTGVPMSNARLGFDPRNQTLSIKNKT